MIVLSPQARYAWLAASILSAFLHWWCATAGLLGAYAPVYDHFHSLPRGWSTPYRGEFDNHYDRLAQGFLHGELRFLERPDPRLLALPDPYDGVANWPYRLHDAVLFEGRYYLIHSPLPALVLFVPWRALTGSALTSSAACSILAALAGALWSLALLRLLATLGSALGPRDTFVLSLAIATCAGTLPAIARPAFYEVAILSGWCCLGGALCLLHSRSAALAGLLAGCAIVSRPNLAPVILLGLIILWRQRGKSLRPALVAILGCLLVMAAYNQARFANPLYFGTHHTLNGPAENATNPRSLDLSAALVAILAEWFDPPVRHRVFPLIGANWIKPSWYPAGALFEPAVGIFFLFPWLLAIPISWRRLPDPDRRWIQWCLLAAALQMIVNACFVPTLTFRYFVDFMPWLILATLIAIRRYRWFPAAIFASLAFQFLLGHQGVEFDRLAGLNPALYRSLNAALGPLVPWAL